MNYPYRSTATKARARGAPPPVLMDIRDVQETLRLGRTKIEQLTREGKLGEVVYLGKRSKRWKVSAVLAYAANGEVA